MSRKRIRDLETEEQPDPKSKRSHIFAEISITDASIINCLRASESRIIFYENEKIPIERKRKIVERNNSEKFPDDVTVVDKDTFTGPFVDNFYKDVNSIALKLVKCFDLARGGGTKHHMFKKDVLNIIEDKKESENGLKIKQLSANRVEISAYTKCIYKEECLHFGDNKACMISSDGDMLRITYDYIVNLE